MAACNPMLYFIVNYYVVNIECRPLGLLHILIGWAFCLTIQPVETKKIDKLAYKELKIL